MDVRVTKGIVLDRDRIEAAVEHWGGRKPSKAPNLPRLQSLIRLSDRVAYGE
jgi:hypothetical protein